MCINEWFFNYFFNTKKKQVFLIAIVRVICPSAFINSKNEATKCAWKESQLRITVDKFAQLSVNIW